MNKTILFTGVAVGMVAAFNMVEPTVLSPSVNDARIAPVSQRRNTYTDLCLPPVELRETVIINKQVDESSAGAILATEPWSRNTDTLINDVAIATKDIANYALITANQERTKSWRLK